MKMYRFALICLSLPALSWGDCEGTWSGGASGIWGSGGNWTMSGSCGSYPGQLSPGDEAFLSTVGSPTVTITIDATIPNGLSSIILDTPSRSYVIQSLVSSFLLPFESNATIEVTGLGSSLTLLTNSSFSDPGNNLLTLNTEGGPIVLKRLISANGGGTLDIVYGNNMALHDLINEDNAVGILARQITLNPLGSAGGRFINQTSLNFSARVNTGSLDITRRSDTGNDYENVNTVEPNGIGASTVVQNVLSFHATNSVVPQLLISNSAECPDITIGSRFQLPPIVNGSATWNIDNTGLITEDSIGVFINSPAAGITINNDAFWNVTNEGSIDLSSIGVEFTAETFDLTLLGGVLQIANQGKVNNQSRGILVNANNFIQSGGIALIERTPAGIVDETSVGSLLQVADLINITGGTLENNELVLVGNEIQLSGDGIIKGIGTFAGLSSVLPSFISFNGLTNSGRIIPGNSPGVMRIVAPYVQTAAGTLEIHILNASNPGASYSQLIVEGPATLNGTVEFVFDEGGLIVCNDTFVFLQASGGVIDEFTNIETLNFPSHLTPRLIYRDNFVLMTLCCPPCPCLSNYIGNFTQTLFTSITDTNNFFIKRELQSVQKRVMNESTKGNVYFGPIGSVGTSEQACNQVGFDYWSAGVVAGADYAFAQGGVGGLVLYEDIESDDENFGWGSFRTQRAHASVYGSYVPEQVKELSIDLMVGGGYDWYRIERNSKTGSPNGYEFDTMISFEYMYTQGNYHVVPMVNLQYAYLKVDDYSEDCGGICFDDQRAKSLSTVLGVWGDYTWKPVTLQANIGWQREYLNNDRTLSFTGGCLNLEGAQRNNLLAGLNVLWQIREVWSVEASYDLIWNNQFDRNGFYLGVNRAF